MYVTSFLVHVYVKLNNSTTFQYQHSNEPLQYSTVMLLCLAHELFLYVQKLQGYYEHLHNKYGPVTGYVRHPKFSVCTCKQVLIRPHPC